MKNNTFIIIAREYKSRVKRKSFIITTILMPLIFVALMALPAAVASLAGPEEKKIAVIDNTGYISQAFLGDPDMVFEITDSGIDDLRKREDLDAILVIPKDIVEKPDNVVLYTYGSPSPHTEMYIAGKLNSAIEKKRLSGYNIAGLENIINSIQANVLIRTVRIDGDSEQESSSVASYIIGLLLTFLLYMFIMLYGQMVMTSIIEEKNNRVLELVVSSVKPTNIMLGKILGIGAVAVTQIAVWAVIISVFMLSFMPSLMTSALTGNTDMEMVQILQAVGNTDFIMTLFGFMTVYLVLGYLFYSTIYAAIGSAVDNIQDASQLQIFALLPIILGMVFSMSVLNDPGAPMAQWLSIIPFTSPMVMMARLPFGVPAWQLIVSLLALVLTTLLMVWVSAKIYRVGIFMYGKKPDIRELIRWARYK